MLKRYEKFFILQIGDKSDSVSVDRLKAVFSSVPVTPADLPVTPADPPPRGRPRLLPASVMKPPIPVHVKKKICFEVPVSATKLRRNPHRTVRGIPPLRRPPASPSGGSNCGFYDDLHSRSRKPTAALIYH